MKKQGKKSFKPYKGVSSNITLSLPLIYLLHSFKPYKGVSSNEPVRDATVGDLSFKPYKGVSSNIYHYQHQKKKLLVSNPIREYLQIS